MKILMIGWYKPQIGGGSHVIQNLANYLKKEHKIYVINMEEPRFPRGLGHWKDNGIDVYQEKLFYSKKFTTVQTLFQTTKRALLLSKKVDLYHTHGPWFSGIGFIDKEKPLVLTIHGYPSLETIASGRIKIGSLGLRCVRLIEEKTVKRADAIIAVGKTLRKWIIEELNTEPEKTFYVPNGIDPKIFKPFNVNKSKENYTIIYSKAITKQNGIDYLIKSLKFIKKRFSNIKLIILGEGPLKEDMKRLAKSIGVRKNVVFLGRVAHHKVPYYLNSSDVYVMPTININGAQETFGISLIEAMACELPVISTAVGGPKEILEEGKRQMGKDVGIMIPQKDAEAIAEKVIYLLEHPDEARKMGKRAREFVLKNYTWDIIAKKTLDVYRYAIEHHKNRWRF